MIVLLGAGGQLGQELVERAAVQRVPIRAFDRKAVDIADESAVAAMLARERPSIVVNAGAYTKVDKAESEPAEAARVNTDGPRVLAQLTGQFGSSLIHISTDYVFDGCKQGAYVESDPIAPLGVYGRTKAAGEEAVRKLQKRHVILRTSWVYSVFGHNILKTALRLAAERDELRFVADQRGCPTSTYDLSEAIFRVISRLQGGEPVFETYHIAGTGVTTWHGFVERVVAAAAPFTGRRPKVVPITTADYPAPARRPANSALDSSKFASAFGFRADSWQQRTDWTVARLLSR